jgi:isoleucyl-tRNA synthetase
MDYKSTLNLPRTDFSMKADLVTREPERLEKWRSNQLYERIQAERQSGEKFILHDGPPFANGDVHIGTALNKILKDIIIKYQTSRGKNAPYIPGWDCHGLPIEFKVTQEMRKAGQTQADPVSIRQACESYAWKYINLQRSQFKRLGIFGDWDNPYLTLDKKYEADELRLFADVVERGFVYRGKKPVYWSIPCRTALAEAEVEYQDHVSQSVYVKFPVLGRPNVFLLIWTTTPWTLPANLAVAYNSGFTYSRVRVNGEEYVLSTLLLPAVAEKCGWQYEILQSLDAGHLSNVEYQHPFANRTGRLLPADFVENTSGTGFVHIAPGHGLEDYGLGRQHGLPIYSPVDDDGRFVLTGDLPVDRQMPAELIGKSILEKNGKSEANEAVLRLLRDRGTLLHEEKYVHSYPHCWRSKTPVIFRAMDQWFIRLDERKDKDAAPTGKSGTNSDATTGSLGLANYSGLRRDALEAIENVEWIPKWGKSRIEAAVTSRPDWCISRQRTWGVPIPAFYDEAGNAILDAQIVRSTAALVEQHGSNLWFQKSAAELWAMVKPPAWKGLEPVAKSNDTLDVWIDSGSSSRSVLMTRPDLRRPSGAPLGTPRDWQADMYLEGSDQHRGWFQSSLLLSLAGNGAPPYRSVLTHGFMVDADREKISKSKQGQGGYEKPQTAEAYVNKWGADIVRLWVASQDFRNDIVVSEERITKVAETYRLLRNTLRYELSNLYDFDPAKHAVGYHDLTGLDRWILGEFSKLEEQVMAAYDANEFHVAYQRISQFAAVELSAIYHDIVKDRLYTDPADSHRRRSTQTALSQLLTGLCQVLAPVLVFTTDEAWELIPGPRPPSVHLAEWRPLRLSLSQEEQIEWQALFDDRARVLTELENARQAKIIGKALEAKVVFTPDSVKSPLLQRDQEQFRELLNVSQFVSMPLGAHLEIKVEHAEGTKCERCWHWKSDIGSIKAHPTICASCAQAVDSI